MADAKKCDSCDGHYDPYTLRVPIKGWYEKDTALLVAEFKIQEHPGLNRGFGSTVGRGDGFDLCRACLVGAE